MRIEILEDTTVVNTIESTTDFAEKNYPGKWRLADVQFSLPSVNKTEWIIDIGPFFDRFKTAKMPLLLSTNATVKALLADIQVRKWIDLKRPDVAAAIDALIALGVTNMNTELKNEILDTPVTADENLALRKQFFS